MVGILLGILGFVIGLYLVLVVLYVFAGICAIVSNTITGNHKPVEW